MIIKMFNDKMKINLAELFGLCMKLKFDKKKKKFRAFSRNFMVRARRYFIIVKI